MTLTFTKISPIHDKETLLAFRRDAFFTSFGTYEGFNDDAYLQWLNQCIKKFPDGFVFLENNKNKIGQVELQIKVIENRRIGFINLVYLISEFRRLGYGPTLLSYAEQFFQSRSVNEIQLRVSPTNSQAIRFYRKMGFSNEATESKPLELLSFRKELPNK